MPSEHIRPTHAGLNLLVRTLAFLLAIFAWPQSAIAQYCEDTFTFARERDDPRSTCVEYTVATVNYSGRVSQISVMYDRPEGVATSVPPLMPQIAAALRDTAAAVGPAHRIARHELAAHGPCDLGRSPAFGRACGTSGLYADKSSDVPPARPSTRLSDGDLRWRRWDDRWATSPDVCA
jgi:hypothetical protein